jgi:hypothetical protein
MNFISDCHQTGQHAASILDDKPLPAVVVENPIFQQLFEKL